MPCLTASKADSFKRFSRSAPVNPAVALAVKDINDSNKKSRSFYGHVIDVNDEIIKFSRYISNHGVRDVYTMEIPINTLLGVYRYELELSECTLVTETVTDSSAEEPAVKATTEE